MRRLLAVAAATIAVPLLLVPARSAPPYALPATVVPVVTTTRTTTYPVYDAAGQLLRQASYRVTNAGGNCCEMVISSMASGRLLDLGGGYPFFSDDRGATWSRVSPISGNNGEGSVVAAPNGDILGITWSIDRVTSYKYDAATGQWYSGELTLHTPFFDRPWLTLAKGPFPAPGGGTVPYITILSGGFPTKIVEFVSYDGVAYVQPSAAAVDIRISGTTSGALPVVADPDIDYLQPPARALITPLPGFGAMRTGLCSGGVALLQSSTFWSCRTLPGGLVFQSHVDSLGWIHELTTSGRNLVYRISTNGGTSWTTTTTPLPGGTAASFAPAWVDFKVHGGLHKMAAAVRANKGTPGQQDYVFVFSYNGGTPSLTEVHHVGLGDITVGAGFGTQGGRLDFSSVAILPDGKVAASVYDSLTREPAMAIEL